MDQRCAVGRAALELAPEPVHVNLERARVLHISGAPYLTHQEPTAEHLSAMFDEDREQLALFRREGVLNRPVSQATHSDIQPERPAGQNLTGLSGGVRARDHPVTGPPAQSSLELIKRGRFGHTRDR